MNKTVKTFIKQQVMHNSCDKNFQTSVTNFLKQ